MKSDLLRAVKDAEDTAAARLAAAEDEAQQILADARRRADEVRDEGRAASDAEYQAILQGARDEATAAANKTIGAGKRRAKAMRKRFEEKVDGVVPRVRKLVEESF